MSGYAKATCSECELPVMASGGVVIQHNIKGTEYPCDGSGCAPLEAEDGDTPEVIKAEEVGGFRIECGVPIPRRNQRTSKYDGVLSALEVGDSFVMQWEKRGPPSGLIQQAQRRKIKLTFRRLSESEIRIWRIE